MKYSFNMKIAYCGIFTSLALILSYLESMVPINYAVPGIKLGLANIVTIVVLCRLNISMTIIITLSRIIIAGILFGNPVMMVYGLSGAVLSITVMCFVKKLKIFTVTGISICGAIFHNIGQLLVAMLILENTKIMYYLPVLLVGGAVAGTVIGIIGGVVMKNIRF